MFGEIAFTVVLIIVLIIIGVLSLLIKWYKKPIHGRAIVITGKGGTRVAFEKGIFVIPVLHRMEIMDITVKTITISRTGEDGLICQDNLRADIKVTFFVRVNNTYEDTKNVALSIGSARASHQETIENLFDAKFSEALKTVGKRFDFEGLYNSREEFKKEIIDIIGRDLNGYIVDDCAIDYLEQTPLDALKKDNILDSEAIKKIIDRTSIQQILANNIVREKEKTIRKQNVEAEETILQLDKQLAESKAKQEREIANIQDREGAEVEKVSQEQRLVMEQAKIDSDQVILVAEQNKEREVLVAMRAKEKTDALEQEKIKRDVDLTVNERERIVALAQIEKEKAIEEEKKNIQEVIRERVSVQKDVVIEEEKIRDTRAFALADREKKVAITTAEKDAEQELVKQIKSAEASKKSAVMIAEQKVIEADTEFITSGKHADAKKALAEADAAEAAALGIAEAQVMEAKALAEQKQGETDANVLELKALAESKGVLAKASAEADGLQQKGTAEAEIIKSKATAEAEGIDKMGIAEANVEKQKGLTEANVLQQKGLAEAEILQKQGLAEANVINAKAEAAKKKGLAEAEVIQNKLTAEAIGIKDKAEAMKLLNEVGKDHEEFKLKLEKDRDVELAQISVQKDIAHAQAQVISGALASTKIDIVGGETMFFEKIIGSITQAKSVDRFVNNSEIVSDIKELFFDTEEGVGFKSKIKQFMTDFGIDSGSIKDLSISALLLQLTQKTQDKGVINTLNELMKQAVNKGIADENVSNLNM